MRELQLLDKALDFLSQKPSDFLDFVEKLTQEEIGLVMSSFIEKRSPKLFTIVQLFLEERPNPELFSIETLETLLNAKIDEFVTYLKPGKRDVQELNILLRLLIAIKKNKNVDEMIDEAVKHVEENPPFRWPLRRLSRHCEKLLIKLLYKSYADFDELSNLPVRDELISYVETQPVEVIAKHHPLLSEKKFLELFKSTKKPTTREAFLMRWDCPEPILEKFVNVPFYQNTVLRNPKTPLTVLLKYRARENMYAEAGLKNRNRKLLEVSLYENIVSKWNKEELLNYLKRHGLQHPCLQNELSTEEVSQNQTV